ncbi:MAG: CotH kinase family protein [Flavobacteriales bacterium]|nr:CotH kinase family protein [Flavobacteriales bacterium]MCB9364359.1 CotH kinase family protein [Flavobacteriales bacterium]
MRYIIASLCVIIFVSCGTSQVENTQEEFPSTKFKEYYIDCEINELEDIYSSPKENIYIPIKIALNGETHIAKMRIRGDTSREDPKKSLKIKFDSTSFSPTEMVFNLNAEYSDKTLIRQYLSSKLIQESGQICFNSELVKIFLNGKYFGLYLKVENIDEHFLKRNKLSKKNNLYKATKDGACMSIFDDVSTKWEKKTNKKGNFNDLIQLIDKVNNTPDKEFYSFVKDNFEYESLINVIALNMMLSNGSTYYHNYYLYHDLYETGKWQMFQWDIDKSLSYYNWMPYTYHRTSSEWESDNPLIERAILCEPIFDDIKKRITELHKSLLNDEFIAPIIDKLIPLIEPVVELDTLDKIKSKNEWLKNINREKEYFNAHYKLLQKQFNEQPLSFKVERFKQTQTDTITFKWEKSNHKAGKKIEYILAYGTDFLLLDSNKTTYITNITDTFYKLNNLKDGKYYWKISATDGTFITEGFNTKNIFFFKKGTTVPSNINSNTTFTKEGSPYVIKQDLTIGENITLTINPGVEIHLKQDVNINCNGNINAIGSLDEPILFTPDNTSKNWGYIYFYDNAKTGNFKHVSFKEGVINFKKTEVTIDSCSFIVKNKNLVDGEKRSAILWGRKGKLAVLNSTFEGNGKGEGVVVYFVDATTENSSFNNIPDAIEYIQTDKGIIRNNLIRNSPDDAIDLNACNNVLIENNILINNTDKGVSVGTEQYGPSKTGIVIQHNLFIGNKTCVSVKDSSFALVKNNTMVNNKNGLYAYKKRSDYQLGGAIKAVNNILFNCSKIYAWGDEWSKIERTHSLAYPKNIGSGAINKRPNFVDTLAFNYFLKNDSPGIKAGENNEDLGAFSSQETQISIVNIHVKSSKEKNSGDWIEIQNNYNLDINLTDFTLLITTEKEEKKFKFPIGTILPRLASLYLVDNYIEFSSVYPLRNNTIDELPKLKGVSTKITLKNAENYVIDSYSYNAIKENDTKGVLIKSNRLNNKTLKTWDIILE